MMATVVVAGMVSGQPGHGGAAWAVLQYILGLTHLGHDVYFVEPISPCDARRDDVPLHATASGKYFTSVTNTFLGGSERSALIRSMTRETLGMSFGEVAAVCHRADLLINLSGILRDPELLEQIPRRMYVDLDPAFTQLWHALEGVDMGLDSHTHCVTTGLTLGEPKSQIHTCGVRWATTLPPVILDWWPPAGPPERYAWTTVANWRSYGSIRHEGKLYGQKAHSLRKLLDLPRLTGERFEIVLRIDRGDDEDRRRLEESGWHLLDPDREVATPDAYRRFIQASSAEIGITKAGYVTSQSGWFSERSAAYLASGRPVVAEDPVFSSRLPIGHGLLAFKTIEEAAEAIEEVRQRYDHHSQRARDFAVEFLDSDRVLTQLLATADL